jgi:chaperonin GroEL
MSEKHLLFREDAREKVLKGATALAEAVRITLGPKSKSVLIGKRWGNPIVCNDGVTIAREMELGDPDEDLGVKMIREAAVRTGQAVGDATSTATLLAHAIFSEGVKNVVAGASAIDIKRGVDRGLAIAVESLKQQSRPVSGRKERVQVATISAHNDNAIGELVADAVERVGGEGVITVEEAKATETTLEVVEGMRFDRGYLSPYFVTNAERMECELQDVYVLLHDRRLSSAKDLLPLLEQLLEAGRPLLLVAEDFEGDALATLVVNKLRGALHTVAVKAPGFGDRRKDMLQDIAILTGATVVAQELGKRIQDVTLADLGRADRIVVTKDDTTIVNGRGEKSAIAARVEQLRRQIKETTSDYDKEKLEERLARLAGGVAVIRVGAPSEPELKSRKEAFEDAIAATKAAAAEGILPGAGLALIRAAKRVGEVEATTEGDARIGLRILRHALEVPTRQIAVNSDLDPGVVVERMRAVDGNVGLDASVGSYVDLYDAGIVDAAKAIRIALENAVSVAGVLLLTEATLTELPEKEKVPTAESLV